MLYHSAYEGKNVCLLSTDVNSKTLGLNSMMDG